MDNIDKYELSTTISVEKELFYSASEPARDLETGCIGHLRADFGRNGDEFWNTWENHCPPFKTQSFSDEFNDVINSLRDNSILKNRAAMSVYCSNHPEAKITSEPGENYGFKIKTDNHVYYLRCNTSRGEYNLYCYAYERSRLEKCFPSLAPVEQTAQSDKPNQKVYKKSRLYALANDEMKMWAESGKADWHCTVEISRALTQSKTANGKHDFSDSAAKIITEYGAERVKWVLASWLLANKKEAVYSDENCKWAKKINPFPPNSIYEYFFENAKLIDEYINAAKKHFPDMEKSRKNEKSLDSKPTLTERLDEGKRKASAQDKSENTHKSNKREEIE